MKEQTRVGAKGYIGSDVSMIFPEVSGVALLGERVWHNESLVLGVFAIFLMHFLLLL